MTEAHRADLVYGHLGEATYETDSQEWHFSRIPTTGRRLKLIGLPNVALGPSLAQNPPSTVQSAIARNRNIKNLAQTYPELVPGIPLLPALAQTSETVCEVTSRHDPLVSELVAFGTALNRDNPRTGVNTIPVIATAGGEAGEAVRLALLTRKHVGWHGNKSVSLNCVEVQDTEQGWWSGHGGPVQQLSFSEGEGNSSSWLAVRYPGATTILQPILNRSIPPYLSQHRSAYPVSRLDPNPIAVLPTERSGGPPHADVSFNPWYAKQFGIVDQEGRWSVWNIEYQNKRRVLWTIKAGSAGNVHDGQTEGLEKSSIDTDGWGAVVWACDVHTILVFGRRAFVLCNIEDVWERFVGPDLVPAKSGDWILGVKRSPSDKSHVFVVTSSRVFWLHVVGFGEMRKKGDPGIGATILLSWRHFRDQDDISLGISVFNDTQDTQTSHETDSVDSKSKSASLVLLYSRLTGLTTVYTFQISPLTVSIPQSVSDPYVLSLNSAVNISVELFGATQTTQGKSVNTLVLRNLQYDIRSGTISSGPGHQYLKGNVRFYELITLFNNLSMDQSLYASVPTGRSMPIRPPDFTIDSQPRRPAYVAKDNFIAPNGVLDLDEPNSYSNLNVVRNRENVIEEESASEEEDQWTVNFEWLERDMQNFLPGSSALRRTTSPVVKSFGDVLETIRSVIVDEPTSDEPAIKLLIENVEMHSLVGEVEQASMHLHDLVTSAPEGNDHVKKVGLSSTLILAETNLDSVDSDNLSLLQIYENLVRRWITPLTPSVPGRVRVTIERWSRQIATQLYLASYSLHPDPGPSQDGGAPNGNLPTEDEPFTLPVRRKSSFTNHTKPHKEIKTAPSRSSSPPASSQLSRDTGFTLSTARRSSLGYTLPTPDPTPSLYSASSISSSHPDPEDPASQRLRSLASLAPQPHLPSSMQNILSHWSLGADPEAYDWEAQQAALETEEGAEETEAQARKRRRVGKMLKGKKENTTIPPSSQRTIPAFASSQLTPPPIVLSASQPQVAAARESQTSALEGGDSTVPTTQEERGPFAGRRGGKRMMNGGIRGGMKKKRPGF